MLRGWVKPAGRDWELKRFIQEQDWSFVTRNSVDFRGPSNQPGSKGQYADVPLHAGLICINGPDSMSAENEVELFGIVLDELGPNQMVNQAIEITLAEAEAGYELVRYDLPEPDGEGIDPSHFNRLSRLRRLGAMHLSITTGWKLSSAPERSIEWISRTPLQVAASQ